MQGKLSNHLHLFVFNALLWLCGVTLLFMARDAIAPFTRPNDEGWLDLDLALVLIAYVLLFLLEPTRNRITLHLRKYIRRREKNHRPDTRA